MTSPFYKGTLLWNELSAETQKISNVYKFADSMKKMYNQESRDLVIFLSIDSTIYEYIAIKCGHLYVELYIVFLLLSPSSVTLGRPGLLLKMSRNKDLNKKLRK